MILYELEGLLLQLISDNNELLATTLTAIKIFERINVEMDLKLLKKSVMIITQSQMMVVVRTVL